jgi:peptidoglycan glycosyltransferase
MNKQIRRVTFAIIIMFCLLVAQLTKLQIVDAKKLQNDPRNGRLLVKNFNAPRGTIQTADGEVVAESQTVNSNNSDSRFTRKRVYPTGDMYSHLTGFYSFTFGSDGLEKEYDADLRGKSSNISSALKRLRQSDYTENVTMTINSKVQQKARDQLGQRKGAVVVMNPKDGSIIAMWSFPSYNPNMLSDLDQSKVRAAWNQLNSDPDKPALPRTYRETYPPGSTFKTVTAATVLEKDPALATKTYPVLSSLPLPGAPHNPLPNFGGGACGGQMPLLLKISCNTGFAAIGLDLGAQNLYNEATSFGFNVLPQKQPLDLPSVASSIFPDPSAFINDKPALAKSAIGQQNVRATPLQMALVAAGIGNNGIIMKPHLMKEIRDSDGNLVRTYQPEQWMQPMSQDNANVLRDMMVGVVQGGTGTRAQISGVKVAGKTGTAQTVGRHSHAWFVGFAPADDPVVAVAVIVESQPGVGDAATGGHVAAPIAREVMKEALAQMAAPNQ